MAYSFAWQHKCQEIFHLGTLSQMGTFLVHRLINHKDKEAVESACSAANKSTLAYLPVLGAGEAILMGVDFPMPVMLKVNLPQTEPNSTYATI